MKCIVCDRCKAIIENPRRCRVITCARPLKPRTSCDKGGKVGILMSREVYDMARLGDNAAYAVSIEISGRSIGGTTSTSLLRMLHQYLAQSSSDS